ncbi:chronic myelogenous leukemia tumor antigen 66 [Holotrichia oblita]|uniref:Chronic myelogenous leukemia tumor antigen 66 n=1 Tax=Holotrichia oblita TaxID=644536 RepID=A0ACB9TQ23_HOLOL|nr:chronic myelogenous leukemia tumor antigen 66 [Holotrichia oblita]
MEVVELIPNRQFIDLEFDGYKLSLDETPRWEKVLDAEVARVPLNPDQYSVLHAKIFGLHNHLTGETINGTEFVYFFDKSWSIKKVYIENNLELQVAPVLSIPVGTEGTELEYNASLKFVSENFALFSNGAGWIYVLETGNRTYHHEWKHVAAFDLKDRIKSSFLIQDVRFQKIGNRDEIHCLLHSIEPTINQQYRSILHWIQLEKQDGDNWQIGALQKRISNGTSFIDYAYLEPSCEALYVISDGSFSFCPEGDVSTQTKTTVELKKKYYWTQSHDDIIIKFKIPDQFSMDAMCIDTQPTNLNISYNNQIILAGGLFHKIDNNLTNWSVENNFLEVRLFKETEGFFWESLIPGDNSGEYLVHPNTAADIHEKLAHFCDTHEVMSPSGITFETEQVEDCDFEDDKYLTFQRLSRLTNEITHKVNINSHSLVLTLAQDPNLSPAVALRHDASKQQRKFSACSPDLSYCVVCEAIQHLFIYRQQRRVDSGELRSRTTGRQVRHIAEQHVVKLPGAEILGIYAGDTKLFLLTTNCIYVVIL